MIHNAVGGAFGNFLDIKPEVLQQNFQINVMTLLQLASWVAPRMEVAGGGASLVTGNTAAYRGKAAFAGFAPSKAAQRVLTECIAREIGSSGRTRLFHDDRRGHRPTLDSRGSRICRMTFSSSHPIAPKRLGMSSASRVRPGRS
ncbi:SDR family NAD(P)-dependent oxidoreductase [Rhizobium laguerreae]